MRVIRFFGAVSVGLALLSAACSGANFEVPNDLDGALGDADDGAMDVTQDDTRSDVSDDAAADSADGVTPDVSIDAGDTGDAGDASHPDASDAAADAGDAVADASDADAPECAAGATRSCYGGPPGSAGVGICHAGTESCVAGKWSGTCVGQQLPLAETCNGLDDNCNNVPDDVSGVGTDCSGGVGAGTGCVARTACVRTSAGVWNPNPQCVGTFVSPSGLATNGGAPSAPLSTISAAIANAQLLGGGADVCVCAVANTAATFTEKVKMVEGTSVIGSFDCASWTRPATPPATPLTTIQDIDAEGVSFPAGITSITALDAMTVKGAGTSSGPSAGVSVIDASPTLLNDNVSGGAASNSVGLAVTTSSGGKASPTVTGGAYQGVASAGGNQIAILLQGASAKLAGVTLANAPGTAGVATSSTALRCNGCGATTITKSTFTPGVATLNTIGLWASGDVTGLTVDAGASTSSTFNGGTVSGPSTLGVLPTATSVRLDTCTGSPKFDNARLNGGNATAAVVATTRLAGLDASGAACMPTFTAGFIRGCEAGGNCIGAMVDAAPVTFASITNGGTAGITGTSSTASAQTIGLQCTNGGCRSITGSSIAAGGVGVGLNAGFSAALVIDHATPIFDANLVTAPSCAAGGAVAGSLYGARLNQTSARLTNSVFRDAPCSSQVEVVYVMKNQTGLISIAPDLIGNTIEYGNCAAGSTCGVRMGLSFDQIGLGGGAGHFDDNIVRSFLGSSGGGSVKSYAVYQYGVNGDWATFSANDLFEPNAWSSGNPVLFYYQGTTMLSDATAVNKTLGPIVLTPNISADPKLDASWHLLSGSPCIDVGDSKYAPATDRDGQTRPRGTGFDIGADEF
jgi:hypothetical protein